jgi:hypothetical protein
LLISHQLKSENTLKNMKKRFLFQIVAALVLASTTSRASVDTFTSSGNWLCPAGITTVSVECWGGGGAGGSVTNATSATGNSGTSTAGGGGAGGAYVIKTNISVIPGNSYIVNVGTNGTPPALSPTDGAHGDGGDSWFNDTSTVLAKGGSGGISKNAIRPAQGNGGACPSGSIGDTINLGGLGGNGDGSLQAGGGGGGSGGTLSAGNNGMVTNGAAAVSGGGAGGNGKSGGTSGPGSAGTSPGGGGGGATASAAKAAQLGGAGAAGKVSISYTIPGATYTWTATSGSADWTLAASWSPSRNSPANNDVLLFNQGGNSTAINVPAETDGKLQVSGNTIINLQASGSGTLTIGETASDSLTVASGSQIIINGTSALNINLPTGARGSISGSMTFSNAADTLTAVDASGITFNSGAIFTQNCLGNAFGSVTANAIIFASGSTFIQLTGGNPFQKTAPASVVVFQTGSLFSCQGNTAPSTSGRTYANFEFNENATNTVTGANALTVSNLSVVQGIFIISMGGGFNLNGNGSVVAGATLNLNNTVTTAIGKAFTVNGNLGGTATITGGAVFTISSTGTLMPGTPSTIGALTFATAPTFNGTNYLKIDRNGGATLADKIVVTNGALTYGGTLIVTNIGATLQPGDTFTNFSAASFSGGFSSIQLPAGYSWNTSQLLVNGTISIPNNSAATFSSIAVTGADIVFKANGTPNGSVTVLTSTNILQPLAQWTTNATGNFDGSGIFNYTNTGDFSSGTPQQFYILKTP